MSWTSSVRTSGNGHRLLHEAMICRQCEAAVASAFRVPLAAVRSASRNRAEAAFARAGAIYLARVAFNLSGSTTGRSFGRHHSTIDHACRRVEARRSNDSGYSRALACLEYALTSHVRRILQDISSCCENAEDADLSPIFDRKISTSASSETEQ